LSFSDTVFISSITQGATMGHSFAQNSGISPVHPSRILGRIAHSSKTS